jgi:hypothetical protein
MLAVLGGLWWTGRTDGRLHLLFPVQPGDGILLKGAHGEIAVIDGGSHGATFADWLGRRLPLARRRIDLLVLTRADSTTLPGHLAAARRYAVGRAVLVQPLTVTAQWTELVQILEEQGASIHLATAGDRLVFGVPANPLQARITILDTTDGRLLLELHAAKQRILLLQSAGTATLPDAVGSSPAAALVVPWRRRMDDPVVQGLRPEAIIFGEQTGGDPEMTLAERRIETARLLHEQLDGEIDLQIDASGMRIATSTP